MKRPRRAAAMAVVLLGACAVNPATGRRELSLVSENQEIQMGREADPQIVGSLGLYDDPALQTYIETLGKRLAAVSERPQLPWTFRVVDDPVVNAFALPGGYIYVTRGILAHFNSEAQLAAVLGHELGHVTARHSASQMSRAQLAQVGLVAGVLFVPGASDFAGAAVAGLQLAFLKFGRDDERQADELGLRYINRVNYDPRPMAGVFTMLERVSAAQGGGRTPEWLSTHPDPANRRERIEEDIAALNLDFSGRRVGDADYLDRLGGMVYGPNPRDGFFRENVFLHPELAFQITFPAGWQTANQRQAVLAASAQQDAIIQLSVAAGASADAAAGTFARQQGVRASAPRRTQVNGLPAATSDFAVTTEQGQSLEGAVTFIEYGTNVYQMLTYGTSDGWRRHEGVARRAGSSFDRVTDRAVLGVQPKRIEIVTLDRAMTLAEFSERHPSTVDLETLVMLNQAAGSTERFARGARLKRVVGVGA